MFMTKIDHLKRKSGLSGWCALNQLGISSSLIGFDSGQHFPARGVARRSISTVASRPPYREIKMESFSSSRLETSREGGRGESEDEVKRGA